MELPSVLVAMNLSVAMHVENDRGSINVCETFPVKHFHRTAMENDQDSLLAKVSTEVRVPR